MSTFAHILPVLASTSKGVIVLDRGLSWEYSSVKQGAEILMIVAFVFNQNYHAPLTMEFLQR